MEQPQLPTCDRASYDDIRQLVNRYATALDCHDLAELATCFTPDAQFVVRGAARLDSSDDTGEARYGPGWPEVRPLFQQSTSRFDMTMHILGQTAVDVAGSSARAETYALSIGRPNGADHVLLRGVRYLDDLRVQEGSWRIACRTLTLDWAATPTVNFSQAFPTRRTARRAAGPAD